MAWMYILECADGSYSVGSTKDLERRMTEHLSGLGSRYTSGRLPVKLVYGEEYDRISAAYSREKQVQNWSRAKREASINGNYEMLPSLAKKRFEKMKNHKGPGGRVDPSVLRGSYRDHHFWSAE
jgi:putative endonuclease